jgi:hypothetical protein
MSKEPLRSIMNRQTLPTWRQMNRDTSPEAEVFLFKLWRESPAWRKLKLMEELNKTGRQIALIGLHNRHPDASPDELRRRLADILLGPELAAQVYGPYPMTENGDD